MSILGLDLTNLQHIVWIFVIISSPIWIWGIYETIKRCKNTTGETK